MIAADDRPRDPAARWPDRVASAIDRLREAAGYAPEMPSLQAGRFAARPVPLAQLINSTNAVFEEVAGLTSAIVGAKLLNYGIEEPQLLSDPSPLAGFVFANSVAAYILVCRDDPLPRRRFTAAHELGHLLLHLPADDAETAADDPARLTGRGMSDAPENVDEAVQESSADSPPEAESLDLSLPWREREANRFAAQLLMPEPVVRALYAHYAGRFGRCPRFLQGHIAGDLLVSRQAVQYRLAGLGLLDGMAAH